MKIIKHIRNQVIFLGLVAAAGYVAYQVLLDDEAKESLNTMKSTVGNSYRQLTGIINDRIGMIMDDDIVEQNRQKVRDDWADLGFL